MERISLRRQLLEQVERPIEEQVVIAAGVQTYYLSVGQGSPILLLHGATAGGSLSWYPLLDSLAAQFRVIAPDCPNYGASGMEPVVHTIPVFMHWLDEFLTKLKMPSVTIIGTSQGGALAMRYALHAPHRVKRLVLINGAGLSSRSSFRAVLFGLGSLLLDIYPSKMLGRTFEQYLFFKPASNKWASLHDYRRYTQEIALSAEFQRVSWFQRIIQLNRPLCPAELRQIYQPMLLLWSANDRLFPPSIARAACSIVPNAHLHIVAKAGHAAFFENPEPFGSAIMQFLLGNLATRLGQETLNLQLTYNKV